MSTDERMEKMANEQVQDTEESEISPFYVFLCLLLFGVALAAIGIVNLREEIIIFTERSKIKSQGKGVIGTIIASDRRYGYTNSKKKQYTYYVYTVRYDGFKKISQQPGQISVGDTVPVLYLPKEPDRALIGKHDQTVSDFRGRFWNIFSIGLGFIIYSAITIAGGGIVLFLIIRVTPDLLHKKQDTS